MPEQEIETKKLVEAVLFMSQNAVGVAEISKASGIASPGHIKNALDQLIEEYNAKDTSLAIYQIADKYMFGLKEPYSSKVSSLANGPEISRGALRILAYINKNENILQSQLIKIFGSTVYDYVKELSEKEFIETKKVGRSKKISTTAKFKEYFNV